MTGLATVAMEIELYDHQEAFVDADGDKYLQGARQTGKSVALAVDAWQTVVDLPPGDTVAVYMPAYAQAVSWTDQLMEFLAIGDSVRANETTVDPLGGATIDVRVPRHPGRVDGPGDVPDYVLVDEPDFVGDDILWAIKRMVRYNDLVLSMAGTPKPESTLADAIAEDVDTALIWATAWDSPDIETDYVEYVSRTYSVEQELADLYGVTPPQADNTEEDRS